MLLMHGYGDDETAWTEVGRAQFIADNLIAQGKLLPLVIVMPYGHPVRLDLQQSPGTYFERNNELYEKDIRVDLLPFIEANFRTRPDAVGRSIVGLSMGGGHEWRLWRDYLPEFLMMTNGK